MSISEIRYMMTLTGGILIVILSTSTTDSLAQSESTTSMLDQRTNVTEATFTATTTFNLQPLFVEQGKITGQRVLAVVPQPQIETSFMTNTSFRNGTTSPVVNAVNIGTTTITLNADGIFHGEGKGLLRSQGTGFAS